MEERVEARVKEMMEERVDERVDKRVEEGMEERERMKTTMPAIIFPVPTHVEPSSGGSWDVELDAPGCELTVALTPDAAAYQHFELPTIPPMAAKITIVSEADTGAQGQRLADIYFCHSSFLHLFFRLRDSSQPI